MYDKGVMIGKGTFQDLSVSGLDFSSLLKRDNEEEDESEHDEAINPITILHASHPNGCSENLDSDIESHHSDHSSSETGSSKSLNSKTTNFKVNSLVS